MKKIILLSAGIILYNVLAAQTTPWNVSGTSIYSPNTGNVGIGTATPQAKLDVQGTVSVLSGAHKFYFSEFTSFDPTKAGIRNSSGSIVLNAKDGGILYLNRDVYADTRIQSTLGSVTRDIASFNANGNVGIGTTTPGNFKLAVEGLIGAREIKVTMQSWADYVFNKDYKLISLDSLEAFIQKNNHLPNIPSAQEVKEKEGIELGAMNAKLLEKIEELTLHMIEMNKRMQQLEKENELLKKTVTDLAEPAKK